MGGGASLTGNHEPGQPSTNKCPGDGIGIHTGLRSQVLRVRVSPRAPTIKCPRGQIGKVTSLKRKSSLGSTPSVGTISRYSSMDRTTLS